MEFLDEKTIKKRRDIVKTALLEALASAASTYDEWNLGRSYAFRKEMAEDLIEMWLEDEDGDVAIDRLVTLVIH